MIAPTVRRCKGRRRRARSIHGLTAPLGCGTGKRHTVTGSLAGITLWPLFRLGPAALHCEKIRVRWPGPFGSGFLSPQPPGVVRIGPVRTREGQRKLVLFVCVGMFLDDALSSRTASLLTAVPHP